MERRAHQPHLAQAYRLGSLLSGQTCPKGLAPLLIRMDRKEERVVIERFLLVVLTVCAFG